MALEGIREYTQGAYEYRQGQSPRLVFISRGGYTFLCQQYSSAVAYTTNILGAEPFILWLPMLQKYTALIFQRTLSFLLFSKT